MKVSEVMKSDVPFMSPDMTWKQAAEFLIAHELSAAPVVDTNGALVGMVSEKDLFHGLFPTYAEWISHPESYLDFEHMEAELIPDVGERRLNDLMKKQFITATRDTPILKVGALMSAREIHQVPVIEEGKVIGMVQRGKIYREILKRYFGMTWTKRSKT